MVSDDNKGITAISYNHLNLPREITFDTGNKILYIYDAAGVKLQKQVIEGSDTTFTDYIGGFVYENDTLQFLQTAEGRVVKYPNLASMQEWAYQYHLKDHLGNVRLTFGEPVPIIYEATMESEEAAFEEAVFEQVAETRQLDAVFNHTPGGNESSRLNVSSEVVGPAKSLAVFPGDTVKMEVYAKYTEPSSNTYEGAITGMAGEIAGAFGNPVVTEGGQYLSEVVDVALAGGAAFSSGDNNVPRAYLQYLLFDKDYVLHQSGFVQISSSANGISAPFDHLVMDVPIDKSGFIYIYTANETDDPAVNAYFDDLKITHRQMVVQADDYYPFGSVIEGLSYKRVSAKENKYLLSDRELQDEFDLNWFHLDARMYDPVLGRFSTQDPLADIISGVNPYNYVLNNPIKFADPLGLMPEIPSNPARDRQSRIHETPGERRQRETGFNDFSHGIERNETRTIEGENGKRHEITKKDISSSFELRPFGTKVFVEGKLIRNTIEGYYFVPLQDKERPRAVDLTDNKLLFPGLRDHFKFIAGGGSSTLNQVIDMNSYPQWKSVPFWESLFAPTSSNSSKTYKWAGGKVSLTISPAFGPADGEKNIINLAEDDGLKLFFYHFGPSSSNPEGPDVRSTRIMIEFSSLKIKRKFLR